MLRKIFITSVVIFLILSGKNAFSAQYEDYEWGMSKEKAVKKVKEKGYNIVKKPTYNKHHQEAIFYYDRLFGEKIRVVLKFTPKSKKLCGIAVGSEEKSVGRDLKPILKDKYGEPTKPNEYEEKYVWMKDGDLSLVLEYDYKTRLGYFSNKYYDIYEQEKQELQKKEAKDKF